jgi:hypothetical protein
VAVRIGEGVLQIDTLLGGWERVTAGYLVEGPAPVLVETGSQSSVPALLAALDELGLAAEDLAGWRSPTSTSTTPAAWGRREGVPQGTVYVHEKGARHLADPSRAGGVGEQVYGDLLDTLYGRLDPTPPERIRVLADGDEVEIGPGPDAQPRRLARPRQAPPGPPRLDVGPALRRRRRRRAPARRRDPAAVDATARLRPRRGLASLERFAARSPSGIALAHYGLVPDPGTILDEAAGHPPAVGARRRAGVAARRMTSPRTGRRLRRRPRRQPTTSTGEKLDTMNGVHSNAAGLRAGSTSGRRPATTTRHGG